MIGKLSGLPLDIQRAVDFISKYSMRPTKMSDIFEKIDFAYDLRTNPPKKYTFRDKMVSLGATWMMTPGEMRSHILADMPRRNAQWAAGMTLAAMGWSPRVLPILDWQRLSLRRSLAAKAAMKKKRTTRKKKVDTLN